MTGIKHVSDQELKNAHKGPSSERQMISLDSFPSENRNYNIDILYRIFTTNFYDDNKFISSKLSCQTEIF